MGVDCDHVALEMWKRNVRASSATASVTAVCKTIGQDDIDWPEEDGRLIIHWSPCCQPFSKARAHAAEQSRKDSGLEQIRTILDLVISKGYRRWSIEEVNHPEINQLVREYATRHPLLVQWEVLDAVAFGCPSERRRLLVSSAAMLGELKSRTSTEYVCPKQALMEASIQPASEFYRNGNINCEPRPISRPAFTVTAGHPLVFCNRDRSLVRCMTPRESAVLVGLPKDWELPRTVSAAQRAAGNVVAPALAKAIVLSALALSGRRAESSTSQATSPVLPPRVLSHCVHEDVPGADLAQDGSTTDYVTRTEVDEMIRAAIRKLKKRHRVD